MTDQEPHADDHAEQEESVEIGTLLQLLASARRRRMIAVLADADGPLTATELTRRIRAHEAVAEDSHGPDEIRVSLQHVHLPKAETCDIIDWDRNTDRVRYRGSWRLDRLLETIEELSDR